MLNVVTQPSLYLLEPQDLRIAVSMVSSSSNTFKGRPVEYYVRVVFGYEQGSMINGWYIYEDFSDQGRRCRKTDFELTDTEENALGIEGEAWC